MIRPWQVSMGGHEFWFETTVIWTKLEENTLYPYMKHSKRSIVDDFAFSSCLELDTWCGKQLREMQFLHEIANFLKEIRNAIVK